MLFLLFTKSAAINGTVLNDSLFKGIICAVIAQRNDMKSYTTSLDIS